MNYIHPQNRNKEYVDWRLKENREKGFLRWLKWRMDWSDLDHYVCNNAYRDHAKMTKEQSYWFSLIFGMTYQSEMAWVIYSQFPDLQSIDLKSMQTWNVDNMTRQKYARDTKYNKGRIVEQTQSILDAVDKTNGSLTEYFDKHLVENEQESFDNIYNKVLELHKYGRMTTWITCQVLHETANLPIRPTTMLAWDDSSWSVRSGLMYLYGRDDMIESKNKDLRMTTEDKEWVRTKENELLDICNKYLQRDDFTHYLLESHLCQYKKLMLGGDYAGHSSGDHVSRATTLKELWPEVDFDPFFKVAMKKHHPLLQGKRENKILRNLCQSTGQLINMHDDFDDLPNMYLELDIDIDRIDDEEYQKIMKKNIDSYQKESNLLEFT